MSDPFSGIFDDVDADAAPAAMAPPRINHQRSWGDELLLSAAQAPALRQASWADVGAQAPAMDAPGSSIADAWAAVPLPNALAKAPSRVVAEDIRETIMPDEVLAIPEADLLAPLWAPDPVRKQPPGKDSSSCGSEPTGEGKSNSSDGDEVEVVAPRPKKAVKKKRKRASKKAQKAPALGLAAKAATRKKSEEPAAEVSLRIGTVVTAPAIAFGAPFAEGAPQNATYRGIVVDATDSDHIWVVRYDDDGLDVATAAEHLTTVVEERSHHLRARRARALEERRRLDRAREAPPLPWTPAETGRLRELVKELGSRTEHWPSIARRLGTGRKPIEVMGRWSSLPPDLFAEEEEDDDGASESEEDLPVAELRKRRAETYVNGDRVEADWKGEGAYFAGRVAHASCDGTCSVAYDDGDFERGVPVERLRRVDEEFHDENVVRALVRRVPAAEREGVLRDAISQAEELIPERTAAPAPIEAVPAHEKDGFAARVAAALDGDGGAAPLCVRNALGKDENLLKYFAGGPKAFLERLQQQGHGLLKLGSFAGDGRSVNDALEDLVPLTPKLCGQLLETINASGNGKRRSNTYERAPCLAGVPRFATALYGAYEDSEQFLVLQPGPSGDLRPHVDYLGSGVVYVLLQGRKKVSVWPPFAVGQNGRMNLSVLASGHRRDIDCEALLGGKRYDLEMRPGDALFIPPLFPHLVRNHEGGSIAYGVNILAQASGRMIERLRDSPYLSTFDKAVFACHYLPAVPPNEAWAATYSEEATARALDRCLQRVKRAAPGLAEASRREAALCGREATVVTPTTPAVVPRRPGPAPRPGPKIDMVPRQARRKRLAPPKAGPAARAAPAPASKASPVVRAVAAPASPPRAAPAPAPAPAATFGGRVGGATSLADMAKIAAAVARVRPPPAPAPAPAPPKRRRSRSGSRKRASSKRSRSPKRGRRRRSRSRSRSRSRRKPRKSSGSRSRSPRRKTSNPYDTVLPPPRRRDASRSRSRGRRRRSASREDDWRKNLGRQNRAAGPLPRPGARAAPKLMAPAAVARRQAQGHYGPAPPATVAPPARGRYDDAPPVPPRKTHLTALHGLHGKPEKPHRYAHNAAADVARPGEGGRPPRRPASTPAPRLSLAEQAMAAARDASRRS